MSPQDDKAAEASNDTETALPPCPNCGKPASTTFKPFCCKRCADVDLHRWLSGSYAIPVSPDEEESTGMDDGDEADRS